MKQTTLSLLFLLCTVCNAIAEEINIKVKGTTDKASTEVIVIFNGVSRDAQYISVTDGSFVYSGKVEKYTFIELRDKKAKLRARTIADSENITLDMQKKKVSGSAMTERLLSIDSVLNKHDSLRADYKAQAFKEKDLQMRKELRQKAMTEKRLYDEFLAKAIEENRDNCLAAYFVVTNLGRMDFSQLKNYVASKDIFTKHPYFEKAIMFMELEQPIYELVGKKFIDFADYDDNDVEHRLSDFAGKGNYVILDFWASWCGPCIKEMPTLETAQEMFGGKGLQIVSVSLDSSKRKWKEAIEKYSLNWIHLGNNVGWRQYHIRVVPRFILINGEGIIESTNLRGNELLEKLQDIYEPM